ncbi:MAG TPA: hypothetical protein VMU42_08490 [Candidatus Sulfotelmatobacter sp.]|nr:hypothetical protein [Candidatus Sulfotelmatobacter sp.]
MTTAFDEAATIIIEQYRREHAAMLALLSRIRDHAAAETKSAPLPRALATEIAGLIEELGDGAPPATALSAA